MYSVLNQLGIQMNHVWLTVELPIYSTKIVGKFHAVAISLWETTKCLEITVNLQRQLLGQAGIQCILPLNNIALHSKFYIQTLFTESTVNRFSEEGRTAAARHSGGNVHIKKTWAFNKENLQAQDKCPYLLCHSGSNACFFLGGGGFIPRGTLYWNTMPQEWTKRLTRYCDAVLMTSIYKFDRRHCHIYHFRQVVQFDLTNFLFPVCK